MSRPSGDLGQQAIRGVVSLGLREGGMKLVAFAGNIALFRLLTPADFGVIVPIAFLAGLVKQFADLGLQPSLIQRGSEPNSQDLRAVFTGQLGLVIIGGLLLFLGGPVVVDSLLNAAIDPWMTRVFALSIFLSAFRVVPAALLERHLQFGRLATADILGSFCYFSLGIGFAIGAAGVWSLVIAHVGASIISTVAVVVARPWWPIPTMRLRVLRFPREFWRQVSGIPYCANDQGFACSLVRATGIRRLSDRIIELGKSCLFPASGHDTTGGSCQPPGIFSYSR